jgi:hypothetical protein
METIGSKRIALIVDATVNRQNLNRARDRVGDRPHDIPVASPFMATQCVAGQVTMMKGANLFVIPIGDRSVAMNGDSARLVAMNGDATSVPRYAG